MKKLKEIKPSLPLTFQKVMPNNYTKTIYESISVKNLQSKDVISNNFYKPISKMIKYNYD